MNLPIPNGLPSGLGAQEQASQLQNQQQQLMSYAQTYTAPIPVTITNTGLTTTQGGGFTFYPGQIPAQTFSQPLTSKTPQEYYLEQQIALLMAMVQSLTEDMAKLKDAVITRAKCSRAVDEIMDRMDCYIA